MKNSIPPAVHLDGEKFSHRILVAFLTCTRTRPALKVASGQCHLLFGKKYWLNFADTGIRFCSSSPNAIIPNQYATCLEKWERVAVPLTRSRAWLSWPYGDLTTSRLFSHRSAPLVLNLMMSPSTPGTASICGVKRHFHCWPPRRAKSKTLQVAEPVKAENIRQFLADEDIAFSEGHTCLLTSCPRHVRKRIKLKELDKLYINSLTGFFVCHSCKKSGTWNQLQDNIQNLLASIRKGKRLPACFEGMPLEDGQLQDAEKAAELLSKSLPPTSLTEESWELLKRDLNIEGLKAETLQKLGVQVTADLQGLILPSYNIDSCLLGIKIISVQLVKVGEKERQRVVTRTVPRIEYHGLFGLKDVASHHMEVVLTASEFDALAIFQSTGKAAVALPKGDSTLPQQVLPLLERFSKVTLWLGGDAKMWASAKQFAKKLKDSRCYLVRPDEHSPNALACVQRGVSIPTVLQSARPLVHQSITTFGKKRQDVFAEIFQAEQIAGVKWKRYPQLNKLLKGHRRGELTVFTGPTGAGKTTFISDYSLDLCMNDVNTLWGSFEINNVRLMKTMLTQLAQMNLSKNLEHFESWADQFEALPMYFMIFHGQEKINKVVETMSHAVYAHDIAHVVVDNLQFMMGVDQSGNATDRFHRQDQIVSSFRKFATNMNCHVTLVIHPRKEKEDEDLTISSIFGSARATQEADNVLILQSKTMVSGRSRKYIQVVKNRFDGEQGVMLLKFNRDSLSFAPKKEKDGSPKGKKGHPTDGHVLSADVAAGDAEVDGNDGRTTEMNTSPEPWRP